MDDMFSIGFLMTSHRKSVSQNTSAAVHTFCDRQKPIPEGAGQYYVAGVSLWYWLSFMEKMDAFLHSNWFGVKRSSLVSRLTSGHIPVKLPDYNNRLRVLVATYVTFSPDGTELLVNMGGEQVSFVYTMDAVQFRDHCYFLTCFFFLSDMSF